MKIILLGNLFFLINYVNGDLIEAFKNWSIKYNIVINDRIFNNWVHNEKYIIETNLKNLSYKLAHNFYSGLSVDDFTEYMGFGNDKNNTIKKYDEYNKLSITELPKTVDWRTKGVVNPVKNQGNCGSCWAFSTISSIESAVAIKTGNLYVLSEQELVDCDNIRHGGRNHGCNGGLMDSAFDWISKKEGVCTETNYPYISGVTKVSQSCNTSCVALKDSNVLSYIDITPNSDLAMMNALNLQPVSVSIQASTLDFQLYSSGVFTGECGTELDHGVALVGYGSSDDNIDYYILRNSWGSSWGSDGYMYIGRGSEYNNGAGQCGVLSDASYPLV